MLRFNRTFLAIMGGGSTGQKGARVRDQVQGRLVELGKEMKSRKIQGRDRAKGRLLHDRTLAAKEHNTVQNLRQMDPRDLKLTLMTDAIFAKGVRYLGCATNITYVPEGNPAIPEVMFCGAENVGKTSLIKALAKDDKEVARSNTDSTRQAMNWFEVGQTFNICDTPGYGGPSVPWTTVLQHASLIRNFVRCRPSLKMVYYCVSVDSVPGWQSAGSDDVSRSATGEADPWSRQTSTGLLHRDMDMLKFLKAEVPNHTIVLCKAEGVNVVINQIQDELRLHGIIHPMIVTSAKSMAGVDSLRFDMVSNVTHTLPTEKLTLRSAHVLGDRLLTKGQISTFRPVLHIGNSVDEELDHWKIAEKKMAMLEARSLRREEEGNVDGSSATAEARVPSTTSEPLHPLEDYIINVRNNTSSRGGEEEGEGEEAGEEGGEDPDLVTSLLEEAAAETGGDGQEAELGGEDMDDEAVSDVLAALAAGRQETGSGSQRGPAPSSSTVGDGALIERPTQKPLSLFQKNRGKNNLALQPQDAERGAMLDKVLNQAQTQIQTSSDAQLAKLNAVDTKALSLDQHAYVEVQKDDLLSKTERTLRLYKQSFKTLTHKGYMKSISQTSPWRNPLLYPQTVVPTANLRINLMKCPEDPQNPYLFQAQCVTRRMDMCFRKPSDRRAYPGGGSKRRGHYLPDKPMSYFMRPTTIPCFPDMVDLSSFPNPQPHQFFLKDRNFWQSSGYEGKALGLRYVRQVTQGTVHALAPTENLPTLLAAQVKKLEEERYGRSNSLLGAATSSTVAGALPSSADQPHQLPATSSGSTNSPTTEESALTKAVPDSIPRGGALAEYDQLQLKSKADQAAHQPLNPSFATPDRFKADAGTGGQHGNNMVGGGSINPVAEPKPKHSKPMLVPRDDDDPDKVFRPTKEKNPHPSQFW